MGRQSAADSQQLPLDEKAKHWNSRIIKHTTNSAQLPTDLAPPPSPAGDALAPQKRPAAAELLHGPAAPSPVPSAHLDARRPKPLVKRKHDDDPTKFCIDVANQHIRQAEENSSKFSAKSFETSDMPLEPAFDRSRITFFSNSGPMTEFERRAPNRAQQLSPVPGAPSSVQLLSAEENRELEQALPQGAVSAPVEKPRVVLHEFAGADLATKLDSLFSEKLRYFNKKSAEVQKGVEAEQKPEDSRHHIKKLLWLHSGQRPFPSCVFAQQGLCHAQTTVRHPYGAGQPMMAYLTREDYLKISQGEPLPSNVGCNEEGTNTLGYQNYCEFCYRIYIQLQVERSKQNNHRVSAEICSRYYRVAPLEYSDDGMYQQTEVKGIRYSHGIFGKMRVFKRNDFVPVMGRLDPGGSGEFAEVIHADEYRHHSTSVTDGPFPRDGDVWLPGWEEVGPFQQLNENAFLEVGQIDPYVRTFYGSAQEPCVQSVLRDHFLKRTDDLKYHAHIFEDLLECVANPRYLELPYYRSKHGPPWKRYCQHSYDTEPPDPAAHRVYYVLLAKINTMSKLLFGKRYQARLTPHIQQKLRVFMVSHQPLQQWIHDGHGLSDAELLGPRWEDARLGVTVSVVVQLYPHPVHHYRNADLMVARISATTRRRSDPLEVCQLHYHETAPSRAAQPAAVLIDLPNSYTPMESFEQLLDSMDTAELFETFEEAVGKLRAGFDENVGTVDGYGVTFTWQDPALRKQRKQFLESAEADEPEPESVPVKRGKKALRSPQRMRSAMLRALKRADEILGKNFRQIESWVAERSQSYCSLLERLGSVVLCDFAATVAWLGERQPAEVAELVRDCELFAGVLPAGSAEGKILVTPETVNGRLWSSHRVLLALLLRVYVLEQLYTLEPVRRKNLRFNLVLLRNSHLCLFRKIAEHPHSGLLTDNQINELKGPTALRQKTLRSRSLLDQYYPYPTRELHQGVLPDYTGSLVMVNFFANCGMDEHPWNKMQYKKPERCCDVREFSAMLRTFCSDPTFYKELMLELELSLKGLFEHCTVSPSFASSVVLDELFDNALEPGMKPGMIQFVLENESLVSKATSESLCYMLELVPGLLYTLRALYRDWFSWRTYANMDMARHCFSVDGHFHRVHDVVFKRVHLQSNRKIFRLSETDFVVWFCALLKRANEARYKSAMPELPRSAALRPIDSIIIQRFVYAHGPDDKIDACDLHLLGFTSETLGVLAELNASFVTQLRKNYGSTEAPGSSGSTAPVKEGGPVPPPPPPPPVSGTILSSAQLIAKVNSLLQDPKQFVLVQRFFTTLRNYQSIRAIKLTNASMLDQQKQRLWEKPAIAQLGYIPPNMLRCAFSCCCRNVKNSWTSRIDAPSTGFEDIAYSMQNSVFTCAKRNHRNSKAGSGGDPNAGESDTEEEEDNAGDLSGGGGGGGDSDAEAGLSEEEKEEEAAAETCRPAPAHVPVKRNASELAKALNRERKIEAKRKRKADRDLCKQDCSLTEVFTVPLVGYVIEMETSKIPGAKKVRLTEQKSSIKEVPSAPYALATCCGTAYSLRDERTYPGGYACGTCSRANELAASFKTRLCSLCRYPARQYHLLRVYDDLFSSRFRRILVCPSCRAGWRRLPPENKALSTLLECIAEESFINTIA